MLRTNERQRLIKHDWADIRKVFAHSLLVDSIVQHLGHESVGAFSAIGVVVILVVLPHLV
jgi:hypothetical protein